MEMKEQGHVNAGFDGYGDSNGKKVADPNGIDVEAAPIPDKKSSKVDQMWDVSIIFCSFSISSYEFSVFFFDFIPCSFISYVPSSFPSLFFSVPILFFFLPLFFFISFFSSVHYKLYISFCLSCFFFLVCRLNLFPVYACYIVCLTLLFSLTPVAAPASNCWGK